MLPGLGLLKAAGTILTVASSAKFGKEVYDKHKSKKRSRKIDEVHNFIGNLDLEALQHAVDSKDEDALVDAVEDIIVAAEAVRVKSEVEEITEDVQETAMKVFNTASTLFGSAVEKVTEKIDEVKEVLEDEDDFEDEENKVEMPTYKEFKKKFAPITVYSDDGTAHTITVDMDMVSTNNKTKTVTFIAGPKEVILTQLI